MNTKNDKDVIKNKNNEKLKYTFITNYKNDEKLRKSFNALTKKTYGFDFEDWYQNGYWGDCYIPYSLIHSEIVIANVSVNLMEFDFNGAKKRYVQIGTVMTDKEYRNQGLSRHLLEKVLADYVDQTDGIYLFANDTVLNFYPKFGFAKCCEYQYYKDLTPNCIMNTSYNTNQMPINSNNSYEMTAKHINTSDVLIKNRLLSMIKSSVSNGTFVMKNNPGLYMFYAIGPMSDLFYYIESQDAFVIAEYENNNLFIYDIIANRKINMEEIVQSFGPNLNRLTLGFTPENRDEYTAIEVSEEDCTLFVLGKVLPDLEDNKIMFPILSHA